MADGVNLKRYAVILSASIPALNRDPKYRQALGLAPPAKGNDLTWPEDAAYEINEAVKSLVRAVLRANGVLVFGGHPTITPLVAQVAAEHDSAMRSVNKAPSEMQPQVEIYQSGAFLDALPREALLLQQAGYAKFHLTEPAPGEKFTGDISKVQNSLGLMRSAMLDRQDAASMFCIGGMEGVEDEARAFAQGHWISWSGKVLRRQICLMSTTGGAANLLGHHGSPLHQVAQELETAAEVKVIDKHLLLKRRLLPEVSETNLPLTPYPVIMSGCIRELALYIEQQGG